MKYNKGKVLAALDATHLTSQGRVRAVVNEILGGNIDYTNYRSIAEALRVLITEPTKTNQDM